MPDQLVFGATGKGAFVPETAAVVESGIVQVPARSSLLVGDNTIGYTEGQSTSSSKSSVLYQGWAPFEAQAFSAACKRWRNTILEAQALSDLDLADTFRSALRDAWKEQTHVRLVSAKSAQSLTAGALPTSFDPGLSLGGRKYLHVSCKGTGHILSIVPTVDPINWKDLVNEIKSKGEHDDLAFDVVTCPSGPTSKGDGGTCPADCSVLRKTDNAGTYFARVPSGPSATSGVLTNKCSSARRHDDSHTQTVGGLGLTRNEA